MSKKPKYSFRQVSRRMESVGTGTHLLPFASNDTPARLGMFNNHLGQAVKIKRPSRRKLITLAERDWGKYTFGRKVKFDSVVIKRIPKYRQMADPRAPKENPYSLLILEQTVETRGGYALQYDIVTTDRYVQHHPVIGMEFKQDPHTSIQEGDMIPAGTKFMKPDSVDQYGNYNPGREVNIAYLSNVGVTEDGFIVSDELADAMGLLTMSERTGGWGRKQMPLNLYGYISSMGHRLLTAYQITSGEYQSVQPSGQMKIVRLLKDIKGETTDMQGNVVITQEQVNAGLEVHYRPFPGVGDYIRPDGLVFATREINDRCVISDLTEGAMMRLDHQWDKPIYGDAGGRVYDVDVFKGDVKSTEATLYGMNDFTEFYSEANLDFYREIVKKYREIRNRHRVSTSKARAPGQWVKNEGPHLTGRFKALLRKAMHVVPEYRPKTPDRVDTTYKGVSLDHWRVDVRYVHPTAATIGYKPSDLHGGKGVICSIKPVADMPIDDMGNRCHLIMDWLSIIKRMNLGQSYEHRINAHSDQQVARVREMAEAGQWEEAFESMVKYYDCVSQPMADNLRRKRVTPESRRRHVEAVINGCLEDPMEYFNPDGVIYIHSPIDNSITAAQMVRNLEKDFPLRKSHITFRGENSGLMRRSKLPVTISSKYMLMLEKLPDGLAAVSGSKLQAHGLPGPINRTDKRGYPMKRQAVKAISETEGRLYGGTIGGEATAEFLDATNNPLSHKAQVRAFLTAEQPTNIDKAINRDEIPLGNARQISIFQHSYENYGIKAVYEETNYDD